MTANGAITLSWGNSNDTTAAPVTPGNAADGNKVEFASGHETAAQLAALKPDATLGLIDGSIGAPRNQAQNQLADSQDLVNQDTGTAGYDVSFRFKVSNPAASLGAARLRDWQRTDNSPGIYENGRIGMDVKLLPLYNLDPTDAVGYQIANLSFAIDWSNSQVIGTIALRLSGTPSVLG